MNDKFLIRLMDNENGMMIQAFYSTHITELLNFYLTAKENDIEIDIPYNYEVEHDKYGGKFAYVKDVRITFGNHVTYTCLNVYVEVMY